jgi:hypothetical protein
MSFKIGQDVKGVYISGTTSLKDIEDKYGDCAARDAVSEWYVGMVININDGSL